MSSGRTGVTLGEVSASGAARLGDEGSPHGGMIPKVETALDAMTVHPGAVVEIAPGGPDAVRSALRDEVGAGLFAEPVGVEHG